MTIKQDIHIYILGYSENGMKHKNIKLSTSNKNKIRNNHDETEMRIKLLHHEHQFLQKTQQLTNSINILNIQF